MNKQILIPIVALIALVTKYSMGIEMNSQEMDIVIEGVLSLAALGGIFMNPKKKKKF